MSDSVIHARNLKKVYRLYKSPRHRFLDMFGLLRQQGGAYTEHAALDGIHLDISRGEKVAFIGRNGAGKSTLLKLLTGVIEPTSGTLEVKGKAHALLQIGSGFHPDFTGRENVYAYLAQLGVTGREADRKYAEIVEFAELEEYIGQPVKTYSSGMAVRLMFATSTAITPDLLVLDEVLGVGDAYFAGKSYERIKNMCEGFGTTLLLVTHDIYSAAQLCSRIIWIDSGLIVMDGAAADVVKAYDDSIRAQEERRLRLRVQKQVEAVDRPEATVPILLEIRAQNNMPQAAPVYFSRIAVVYEGETIEVPLDSAGPDPRHNSHLVIEASRWGEVQGWKNREARPMLNYGGSFHKVAAVAVVPSAALRPESGMSVELEYWSEQPLELEAVAFVHGATHVLGQLESVIQEWVVQRFLWTPADPLAPALQIYPTGDQGAGDIRFTRVEMLNQAGELVSVIQHGLPVSIRFEFSITRSTLRENAQVFVVFSKENTKRICKFMTSELEFNGETCPRGSIVMRIPKMMLSAGTYSVAAEIAASGYADEKMAQFFSVDPRVYHCLTHAFEFTVTDSGWIGDYTVFEGEGEWSLVAL